MYNFSWMETHVYYDGFKKGGKSYILSDLDHDFDLDLDDYVEFNF